MSNESLQALSTTESIHALLDTCVLVKALAELQQENKLQECRLTLRALWKRATSEKGDAVKRHAAEMAVDIFFDFDGDMSKAYTKVLEWAKEATPSVVWKLVKKTIDERSAEDKAAMIEAAPRMREQQLKLWEKHV